MKNAECKVQEAERKESAPLPEFCILHFALCILPYDNPQLKDSRKGKES